MTLVILAAGMGSRFGGLKQLEPITPQGEFIIDFSIYDAILSGFDRVVVVIKEENLELFKQTIANRVSSFIPVEFVFQSNDLLINERKSTPLTRIKPWGTAHAVLCCEQVIGNDTFAIINADDFYGRNAFMGMARMLSDATTNTYYAAGYSLDATLTKNGSVNRGISYCQDNKLISLKDHSKIVKEFNKITCTCDGTIHEFSNDTLALMNFFGFTPTVFQLFREEFEIFLQTLVNPDVDEFTTSRAISNCIKDNRCTVTVFPANDRWLGVTYAADKNEVTQQISKLIHNHVYPEGLWRK